MYELKNAESKALFQKLFNLYMVALSQYNPWLGDKINKDGDFLAPIVEMYFEDGTKHPQIIWIGKKPVGLFVYSEPGENGCTCGMDEIYVLPAFRKQGIAGDIAERFLKTHSGVCGLYILADNTPSQAMTEKLCGKLGLAYTREKTEDGLWNYRINL